MPDLLANSLSKLGQGGLAIFVVFAVILIVFFAAGRATGRFSRPLAILVFLGPAAVLMIVGLVIPAIRTFVLSFYDASGQEDRRRRELYAGPSPTPACASC